MIVAFLQIQALILRFEINFSSTVQGDRILLCFFLPKDECIELGQIDKNILLRIQPGC